LDFLNRSYRTYWTYTLLRTVALAPTPAMFSPRCLNTPVECRERSHNEKQERIRRRVQREVEKAMHQHSETSTQCRQRNATPEIIFRARTRNRLRKQQ